MNIPTRLIFAAFSKIFRASKDVTQGIGPQLIAAVNSVSAMGKTRLKEFVAAIPIFVLFIRELLRQRDQVQARSKLYILGAAAALSTLGLTVIATTLGSGLFQLGLLFAHPLLAIALFTSEKLITISIVVVLVWLIIYTLNYALSDDPAYQRIRDQLLPPTLQDMLAEVQADIERGGSDLEALRKVVEERLMDRGTNADAEKLEKSLQKLEKIFRNKASKKVSKMTQSLESNDMAN